MKKNKRGLQILVDIVLAGAALGAGGYLLWDKTRKNPRLIGKKKYATLDR